MIETPHHRVASTGRILKLIAFGHTAVGAALYGDELRSIARDRGVGAVPYRGPKATAFWFLTPAPFLWTVGHLVGAVERAHDEKALRTSARVGFATAAIGVACMPISGWWLQLLVSLRDLREARELRP
jgi:hypothetical protein